MASGDDAVLTVPEVAQRLKISHDLAYRLIRDGSIPAIKLGRSIRVPRDRFEEWLQGSAKGSQGEQG